jgi:hypothetical protein
LTRLLRVHSSILWGRRPRRSRRVSRPTCLRSTR